MAEANRDLLTRMAALMELQQQQIALLQQQLQAQQPTARQIPLIQKLTKAEDLDSWRSQLKRVLRRYNLERYILEDIPAPTSEAEHDQWLKHRLDVDDYIQATIPGHTVWNNLEGLGWDSEEGNPKKTFDLIVQYFE